MIIKSLLDLVYKLFSVLFTPINVPSFSDGSVEAVNDFLDMIFTDSQSIIGLFVPWAVVKVLLPIVIALAISLPVYHLVMWIIRKIPFLGMS